MNLSRIFSRTTPIILLLLLCRAASAQVNSGSNGSDGAFNPTSTPSNNVVYINMADHPDGIYHYTSVNIPNDVTVLFIPNANNTPVVWLVQSNVTINGVVNVSGQTSTGIMGGIGGPGGFRGGNAGTTAGHGQGPGGGLLGVPEIGTGNASFGTLGSGNAGPVYGNGYLLPLVGGSGGGSFSNYPTGGGGGGGAILIAASQSIALNGTINAEGGRGAICCGFSSPVGGAGSGGAVRLFSTSITGSGLINARGGIGYSAPVGGFGRVRFDVLDNNFGGTFFGVFSQGYQPIIIPTAGQGAQLTVTTVGGVPVSTSPTGVLATPDAVLSAQQNNPVPIVVHCSNIPLNTQITVSVKPVNGTTVSATGLNNTGTLSSSTATISINMPRGGGIIYASAATGN